MRLKPKRQKPLLRGLDAMEKKIHGRVAAEVASAKYQSTEWTAASARGLADRTQGSLQRYAWRAVPGGLHPAARKRIQHARSHVQAPTGALSLPTSSGRSQRLLPEVCCAQARKSDL